MVLKREINSYQSKQRILLAAPINSLDSQKTFSKVETPLKDLYFGSQQLKFGIEIFKYMGIKLNLLIIKIIEVN